MSSRTRTNRTRIDAGRPSSRIADACAAQGVSVAIWLSVPPPWASAAPQRTRPPSSARRIPGTGGRTPPASGTRGSCGPSAPSRRGACTPDGLRLGSYRQLAMLFCGALKARILASVAVKNCTHRGVSLNCQYEPILNVLFFF